MTAEKFAAEKFAALIKATSEVDPDGPEVRQLLDDAADQNGAIVVSDWERKTDYHEIEGVPHWHFECWAERS